MGLCVCVQATDYASILCMIKTEGLSTRFVFIYLLGKKVSKFNSLDVYHSLFFFLQIILRPRISLINSYFRRCTAGMIKWCNAHCCWLRTKDTTHDSNIPKTIRRRCLEMNDCTFLSQWRLNKEQDKNKRAVWKWIGSVTHEC